MNYFAIGKEDIVLGMGMVGVEGIIVHNAAEAHSALQDTLSRTEIGIVIIEEEIADLIRGEVDKLIFTMNFPLLVEVPGRASIGKDRPDLRQIVNKAIGIKL